MVTKKKMSNTLKNNRIGGKIPPNPEVSEIKRPRQFSAAEKLRILNDVNKCKPGEQGALLRREGIYSGYVSKWRKQHRNGALSGLKPLSRGPKDRELNPLASTVAALEKEKIRLEKRLKQAQAIIDVQKKVSEILGLSLDVENQNDLN
jgi:transposase